MGVALPSPSSGDKNATLAIFGDLACYLAGLGVLGNCSQWDLQDNVLSVSAGLVVACTILAILRDNVLPIFKVE